MSQPLSLLLQPELRDMVTKILSFIDNPSPMRITCKFMVDLYDYSGFLEAPRSCPFVVLPRSQEFVVEGVERCIPIILKTCRPTVVAPVSSVNDDETWAVMTDPKFDEVFANSVVPPDPKIEAIHYSFCTFHLADVTRIPTLDWHNFSLPSFASHVRVSRLPDCARFGDRLFQGHPNLTEIALDGLPTLTDVGHHWMMKCPLLVKVRLTSLEKLRSIGDRFLFACPRLTDVAYENLPVLSFVGEAWMALCPSLSRLRFHGIPNLSGLGTTFMRDCPKVDHVDDSCGIYCPPRLEVGNRCPKVKVTGGGHTTQVSLDELVANPASKLLKANPTQEGKECTNTAEHDPATCNFVHRLYRRV